MVALQEKCRIFVFSQKNIYPVRKVYWLLPGNEAIGVDITLAGVLDSLSVFQRQSEYELDR